MADRSPRRRRGHMRVFVYGSLLRGLHNHRLLEHARFIGPDRTKPCFTLIDLGSFPAMIDGGSTPVIGELWEVDAATLERLDALESHPRWYVRTPVVLASRRRAETYLMPPERVAGRPRVESGDWRRHHAEGTEAGPIEVRSLGPASPPLAHTRRYLENEVDLAWLERFTSDDPD